MITIVWRNDTRFCGYALYALFNIKAVGQSARILQRIILFNGMAQVANTAKPTNHRDSALNPR